MKNNIESMGGVGGLGVGIRPVNPPPPSIHAKEYNIIIHNCAREYSSEYRILYAPGPAG